MNTENKKTVKIQSKNWIWPFVKLSAVLALAALWAYYCSSCMRQTQPHDGTTQQSTGSGGGNGTGAGASGDGPGAGKSGSGSGKSAEQPRKESSGSSTQTGQPGNDGTSKNHQESAVNGDAVKKSAVTAQPRQVESLSRTARPPETHSGNGGNVTGRKGFYGIATGQSTRAVFIVDTSGSMGSMSRELPDKTRVDVLKIELIKSIFDPKRKSVGGFVILSFNSGVKRFPQKNLCRYRNTKDMKEARSFIDSLSPGGGTMMCSAWQEALNIIKEKDIDTVYFMTDGMPGDSFNDQWLKEKLKQHRLNKLKIHCISVGMDQQFMKEIADHTKGKYIYIP